MNSILRHGALAIVAATLITTGLVAAALTAGLHPVAIVALAMAGGTIFGACVTGSAFMLIEVRNERMAQSIGARLARSLAAYPDPTAGPEPATALLVLTASNDDRRLAVAA